MAQITPPCSSTPTVGALTLNCSATRASGISPLLVFFDCTNTTDTAIAANFTPTQDVAFQWSFGDPNASGTGVWLYGSNPSGNSKNMATGIVAAHLYVLPVTGTTDTSYIVQVWAYDGTNTATCTLNVTAFAPSGSNGFPGSSTICYFNSAVGSGCPTGATQTTSATFHVPAAGQRVLYKCGDTFTGAATIPAIATWSVGAYGTCSTVTITSATQANYPQFSGEISINLSASDGRLADYVCNTGGNSCIQEATAWDPPYVSNLQITLDNIFSNATNNSFTVQQATQQGYIELVTNQMGLAQGTWVNLSQNNCIGGSISYATCITTGWVNVQYSAVMGSHFNGAGGAGGAGVETVRIPACRMCVFTNSDYLNANTVGAVFKLHSGQFKNTQCQWLGQWTEQIEISDNFFSGSSGAELVENISQNGGTDERLRNIVFERNILNNIGGNHQFMMGAMNETVRNNIFKGVPVLIGNRGSSTLGSGSSNASNANSCTGTATTAAPQIPSYPQYIEFYNNSFTSGGAQFGPNNGSGLVSAANNSISQNNFVSFSNAGSNNKVSNNTTAAPGFSNGSGTLSKLTDFKPTTNFAGAAAVPNFFDAFGLSWISAYTMGAVSQAAP